MNEQPVIRTQGLTRYFGARVIEYGDVDRILAVQHQRLLVADDREPLRIGRILAARQLVIVDVAESNRFALVRGISVETGELWWQGEAECIGRGVAGEMTGVDLIRMAVGAAYEQAARQARP